jgi:hypothetical protein
MRMCRNVYDAGPGQNKKERHMNWERGDAEAQVGFVGCGGWVDKNEEGLEGEQLAEVVVDARG